MLNLAHFEGFCVKMCRLELDSANFSQRLKRRNSKLQQKNLFFLQRHKPAEIGQKNKHFKLDEKLSSVGRSFNHDTGKLAKHNISGEQENKIVNTSNNGPK